jgi:Putative peptidoglycan binding domain
LLNWNIAMLVRIGAALTLLLTGWSSQAASPPPTTPVKKKAAKPRTRSKTAGTAASKTSKTPKKTKVAVVRSRSQSIPTPERFKQIQEALAAKGYLPSDQATGQWNDASVDALKRFQAAQNIESTGRINSLSLIALGLGPKRDGSAAAVPQASPAAP